MPNSPDDLARFFEALPQCEALGVKAVMSEPGRALMRLDYADIQVGNPVTGYVHGGIITTLLDTVCSLVAVSASPSVAMVATLDLRIDYLKPATPGEPLFGQAAVDKETRHVAFIRGEAHHGDENDPVAHCTATIMITEREDDAEATEEAD